MRFNSVSFRIFFWLSTLSLFPLLIMSEAFLFQFEKKIQQSEISHLAQISDKKVKQISAYIKERIADVERLSKSPITTKAILEFDEIFRTNKFDSLQYKAVDDSIRDYFTVFLASGYYDLFLIRTSGEIAFTVKQETNLKTNLIRNSIRGSGLTDVTNFVLAEHDTAVSDFSYYEPSNELAAFIATPILKQGKMLGVLALQVDSFQIFDVVADNVGMGETGETVIARKVNNSVSFMAPLKFISGTDFSIDINKDSESALPMQHALKGEAGQGISIDYRGEEVIAVWRYLPEFQWGIVVKKDSSEAFADALHMQEIRWFILITFLILVLSFAYLIGQSIVRPILNLTTAAKKISSGDLQQLVEVEKADEVGQLASTFNKMTKELRKTNANLIHKVEEANRANKAKSKFLSRMSHELRTPMNAILGFSQILTLDSEELNETQQANIQEILNAGHHLLELINELLDLAKIESGKMTISMEDVSLDDLLRQCVTQITVRAEERDVTITDNISDKGYVITTDPTRFKQVLLNLLSNAVKYNCNHGTITLESEIINQQQLRISVTDIGVGLKKEEIKKLFKSFERLNVANNVEGTGIGLVISKHLIELMQGSIGVESEPGKGSTFWIIIPLAKSIA